MMEERVDIESVGSSRRLGLLYSRCQSSLPPRTEYQHLTFCVNCIVIETFQRNVRNWHKLTWIIYNSFTVLGLGFLFWTCIIYLLTESGNSRLVSCIGFTKNFESSIFHCYGKAMKIYFLSNWFSFTHFSLINHHCLIFRKNDKLFNKYVSVLCHRKLYKHLYNQLFWQILNIFSWGLD